MTIEEAQRNIGKYVRSTDSGALPCGAYKLLKVTKKGIATLKGRRGEKIPVSFLYPCDFTGATVIETYRLDWPTKYLVINLDRFSIKFEGTRYKIISFDKKHSLFEWSSSGPYETFSLRNDFPESARDVEFYL